MSRYRDIERALVAERIHLWSDLTSRYLHDGNYDASGCVSLVRRIRFISKALGYQTDGRHIPMPYLMWLPVVENVKDLGIHASIPDWLFRKVNVSLLERGETFDDPPADGMELTWAYDEPDYLDIDFD